MSTVTEKPYAGKLSDERKAERRARLITAGLALLGSAGTSGTSVRAVCQTAGLTSRYFYESFANIDELLLAVFDDIMARTVERVGVSIAESDGSVRGTVKALIDAFVTVTLDDPHALRIGFVEAWSSEALMRRRVETLHVQAKLLAHMIAPEGFDDGRLQRLEVTAFMVTGGLLVSILGWLDGSLAIDRDVLVAHFAAAAVAALESALQESTT